ncbi:MAG TPA: NADH:flavin oxidoreductase/NADH oxidase [Plantibacter sp.]|uniref:NADH:flavin oxidoreductase/NADH oxidase n=1 Tax=unclassified Plantibacter TaxID=2624265 RepID=UPI002BB9A43D|nr:NADH:flavin oxidoreductase/NADH oxidase [Plantibacter sp.]
MPALFDPITLRGITIRNRLWIAPMCQYSVSEEDGVPTSWHLMHLGQFAAGGFGLILSEATAVSPEGRISPQDTGIWTDGQQDAWKPITAFITEQGAVPGIQLAHAGRKASTWAPWGNDQAGSVPDAQGGWSTVAPSAEAFPGYAMPVALDQPGIDRVIEDFRTAAIRSVEAGFQVIELHAAHGYLLHQFLSPLVNHRDDTYGGSLENRARLLLQIVDAIREVVPEELPLFVRFSATDWADGGWDEHQTATVANWCAEHGADFFDISTGGAIGGVRIPLSPGYQVPFAAQIGATGVDTSAVGLITDADQAAGIVADGRAAAVMVAREALRDPHFALRAAEELGVDIEWPGQYERAKPRR